MLAQPLLQEAVDYVHINSSFTGEASTAAPSATPREIVLETTNQDDAMLRNVPMHLSTERGNTASVDKIVLVRLLTPTTAQLLKTPFS